MAGRPAARARAARTEKLLSDPDAMVKLVDHISGGGTLSDYVRAHDVPYGIVSGWIAIDPERARAYQIATEIRSGRNRDDIIGQWSDMATADIADAFVSENNTLKPIHEIPESARRMISSIDVLEHYDKDGVLTGITKKIKLWDKNKTLEMFAKHHRMLGDKNENDADKDSLADVLKAVAEKLPV